MDFAFTAEQDSFRADLRTFLDSELGPDFRGDRFDIDKDRSFERAYVKKLAAKGWLTAAWPKKYGGLGLGHIEQAIMNEELHYHRSPHYALTVAGVELMGPTLMVYGTDEARINKVVDGVRTGTMGINGGIWYSADVPFGGYKASGIGREMGVRGFEEYLEIKAVARPV